MAASELEQRMRMAGRSSITTTGMNHDSTQAAIEAAKGLMQGAIDELITMLGEKVAYEIAQARVDQICRPTEAQIEAWKPRS